MKRLLSTKFLVFTLLLASISVAAVERPFAASGSGIATFIIDGNGNPVGAEVVGSGQATHLGRFTNIGQVFFTPDPDRPNIVHPSGQATLTAADGDKVNIVVEDGEMDITTGIATGHFRFTGGTGKFANATGITSLVVVQNFVTGGYELTMVGDINY